ncbi:MAG: flagellar biosynthesis regulator FlaF [Candidatus Eisenbacteria bacterium]|nr:flagellar biosynthesis regulator FlaF [Candidatus Latescibacterota bacterium]MBD3300963.1 flagellar biosynthesis regulator FlaF [Candidatus Eisenbacteria bacterium]
MMYPSPEHAYEDGQRATQSGRDLEAAALLKMARMLESARENLQSAKGRSTLLEALHRNQRLWTLFQAELAQTDHDLPIDLRVDLLRISSFVDKRTVELLTSPDPKKIQALIDINRHIALGLTGSGPPAASEPNRE